MKIISGSLERRLFESVDADMEIKEFLKSTAVKKVLKELGLSMKEIVIDDKYKSCVRFMLKKINIEVNCCIRKQGDMFYYSARGTQYATAEDGKDYGKSLDVGIIRQCAKYAKVDEPEEKKEEEKPEEKKPEPLHDNYTSLSEGAINDAVIEDVENYIKKGFDKARIITQLSLKYHMTRANVNEMFGDMIDDFLG